MASVSCIKRIVVTEKSTDLEAEGKYVFEVDSDANKNEIKKDVKMFYNVDAVRIGIINLKPKTKRWRRIKSARGGYKKAIVTLKAGQKIDTHKSI